ncbi:cupin domain-containing protein [Fulvivirgaceae bacterium BMA10]|uniref:Cupin domain-containing protein n=1 Tax=Splendidivirga corallicola TaxID=3051826 RepID=A0ABT8KX11_9BACT|nr:cupin domain-containing protein [Fulvivirgaceae bacterium BMA10]
MDVINLEEKYEKFGDHWNPRIIGELNGQYVKIAKVKGDFVWHSHENEDELFQVIKGTLMMDFRDKTVEVNPGEILIVPKGVEHRPRAKEEVQIMMFEPKSTVNTGGEDNELTKKDLETI